MEQPHSKSQEATAKKTESPQEQDADSVLDGSADLPERVADSPESPKAKTTRIAEQIADRLTSDSQQLVDFVAHANEQDRSESAEFIGDEIIQAAMNLVGDEEPAKTPEITVEQGYDGNVAPTPAPTDGGSETSAADAELAHQASVPKNLRRGLKTFHVRKNAAKPDERIPEYVRGLSGVKLLGPLEEHANAPGRDGDGGPAQTPEPTAITESDGDFDTAPQETEPGPSERAAPHRREA